MRKLAGLCLLAACLVYGQTPPASEVFDTDAVHRIDLTFAQPDWWQRLTTNFESHDDDVPYLEASLSWGKHQFDVVGVRFKGSSSYHGANTSKKPFRIKLNEFIKGQKIDGMASFGLSNAWNDPSFVREKPYYELAAAVGLKAPRCNFAALYINGTYWGLYVLAEIVNSDFLKHFFGAGNDTGNLYKGNLGASLAYLGDNPDSYKIFLEKQSNEDQDDWSDLIAFTKALNETPIAQLKAKLDSILDIDSFLTALALDNFTVNIDSYAGLGQNYYIYRRPSDNRWEWIPWDPSLAFGALSANLNVAQLKQFPLEWTTPNAPRPLATRLWQVPDYKLRYREIYQDLVTRLFIPQTLAARMDALRDRIRPFVREDTRKLVTMEQFEQAMSTDQGSGAPGTIPGLRTFLADRAASVKAQLAGQSPLLLMAAPASLAFAMVAGDPTPRTQSLSIETSGSGTPVFTASSSSSWLTISPASGALPANLTITANGSGLAPGSHSASVTVAVPGAFNSPFTIPVTLVITSQPSIVANPASLLFSALAGHLSQTIHIVSTAPGSAFTTAISPGACGNFLSIEPTTGITPASIAMTASTINHTAATCTAEIAITSSAGLAPARIPVTLVVSRQPTTALPEIAAIVNAASYSDGAVAPGEIVTIFGSNFASSQVEVLFDGAAAPLLYASRNQIGAIAPFELQDKLRTNIQVKVNNLLSPQIEKPVTATAPGLFTVDGSGSGPGAIVNQSGAVNSAAAPAAKGSTISIYLTGAGQLDPVGTSGAVGGSNPLQRIVAPVLVAIAGEPAVVSYAGAVPGAVQGLYQINASIPSTTPSGSVPVAVSVGTAQAKGNVTVHIQ